MAEDDTDTLLAIVQSLLDPTVKCDSAAILTALVEANGDAAAAAEKLNSGPTHKRAPAKPSNKRKRTAGGLESWLKPSITDEAESITIHDEDRPEASSSQEPLSKKPKSAVGTVNLMDVLKQAPTASSSSKSSPTRPLTLGTPALVAQHSPCTLHTSILPPELACRLFYKMIDESADWSKNKWWLFDRVVESPHLTSFYAREGSEARKEEAKFWYNGRQTADPRPFLPEMEEACEIIEKVVNEELHKRERFRLEWGGTADDEIIWRANVAASNCYRGSKESVGPHSDQLTYLGPYPTIASLSLGTARIFRLRETIPTSETGTRAAQTFNIPLPHNSLVIMHASCQERFKHSIPPQSTLDLFHPPFPHPSFTHDNTPSSSTSTTSSSSSPEIQPSNIRINITFRFYRPDFSAPSIPRCKCDVPMILRADMKNRTNGETDRYWWNCYAGAQNDGKGCEMWKVMDMKAEGRGPTVEDVKAAKVCEATETEVDSVAGE